MFKKRNIVYLIIAFSLIGCSQNYFKMDSTGTRRVDLGVGDTLCSFYILTKQTKLEPKFEKKYYWFNKNKLGSSQGAYLGYLLDGEYYSLTRNNDILSKGEFKSGLKDGIWLHYHINGFVNERIEWKSGSKNGIYSTYNEKGELIGKGKYKNGEKHGRFFHADSITNELHIVNYRHGELKPKKIKIKKEKIKFDTANNSIFKIFNRKDKNDGNLETDTKESKKLVKESMDKNNNLKQSQTIDKSKKEKSGFKILNLFKRTKKDSTEDRKNPNNKLQQNKAVKSSVKKNNQ